MLKIFKWIWELGYNAGLHEATWQQSGQSKIEVPFFNPKKPKGKK